ncbi:MAG: ATP-binding protein [Luminiphilus sp.]|nr:ATP-binding protein [Luminiphilus sp.]
MIKLDQFWDELQGLFTVVGQIDSEGVLVRASPLLAEKCPIDGAGPIKFFEHFKFKRPTPFDGSLVSARGAIGELFLGFSEDLGFAIRGQVMDYTEMGLDGLCFVGVPWLWWIEGNTASSTLTMSDFPVHDVQMDQLFFMSTQQSMVEDLQALNVQLKSAKQDVERANDARQKYFHHVSHEMRTPLNGVISALSLMSDFKLEGKLLEYSELASKSADRLLEVVNFTLETASLESHVSQAESSTFRLDDLIDECLMLARPRALEKGLELRRSGERGFMKSYRGRLKLLRQVLGNLLSNAVKFSHSGAITLGASMLDSNDSQGDMIEFFVSDQGPGIPADAIEKLFEPFATGLSAATEHVQGTGLGLSIVERFVEALGGEVIVESSVGEGTIFCLKIPLSFAPKDAVLESTRVALPQQIDEFSGAVLLVDDNQFKRQLNGKVLESMGCNVAIADSGEKAVALIESNPKAVDLVIMTVEMPGLSGFDAAQRILDIPGAENIPMFGLTAHCGSSERLKAENAGMTGVLGEPLLVDDLRNAFLPHLPSNSTVSETGPTQHLVDKRRADAGTGSEPLSNHGAMVDREDPNMSENDKPLAFGDDNMAQDVVAFDREPIDRLVREVGIVVLDTLVDKFLGESTDRWESLRKAMADEEKNIIIREAHTLGSACLTFGLAAAGGSFRKVEASALAGGVLPVADQLPAISEQLGLGIRELKHLLSEQRLK